MTAKSDASLVAALERSHLHPLWDRYKRITPVSPHALTNRPLVVQDSAKIEIHVKMTEETYLTVDGQVGTPMQVNDRVHCCKSGYCVQLYRQQYKTFFDVLRQKLKWGER